MIQECIFCDKEMNKNGTIYETPNFFVMIGIGIAAPGHVMLIPKDHYSCLAQMPDNLRDEFVKLKKMVFNKIKEKFCAPFMVEYGILGQSVAHAHLHFIPKERKHTKHYPEYKIDNLFLIMKIPSNFVREEASMENARKMLKKYGGYIYLEDEKAELFADYQKKFTHNSLSYRDMFNNTFKTTDIPLSWKNMTQDHKMIDLIKKRETKEILIFD